ncbi:MAG: hypothetical protein ACXWT3_15050 [Methylococcaceae bacterium]
MNASLTNADKKPVNPILIICSIALFCLVASDVVKIRFLGAQQKAYSF